ncbi:RNA-binding signal recognition particle subunit srp14 [Podila epicladia]|nr:RNA-binding signal recognition particle subunit srp14 [Podila epicladia]KAG0095759.1 RNA-binding signal recognition particle subunit srp14 [Podila epicladia]
MLVDNDKFLTGLAKTFEGSKDSKSVYLTMKRYTYSTKKTRADAAAAESASGDSVMTTANDADKEYPTLVRLECGNLKKISTLVQPQDLDRFMVQYTNIIKINMDSLKKKERKKAPKVKKATA